MNKKYIITIASVGAAVAVVASAAVPAFAQTLTASITSTLAGVNKNIATMEVRIETITNRANQEISRRITALTGLQTRVDAMARLSATDKDNVSSTIAAQISALTALQAQVGVDAAANNTTSLKIDVQSITKSYRIFALVLPQGSIEAASDRVLTIVGIMNDLSTKFSARISAAQAAGNDVTAAQVALTDMNSKTLDANTQAQAAATEVAALTPDNGDATIMASNTATLKDAHAKIQAAQQDFTAARADAEIIIKALGTFKVSATVTSSVTTSTSSSSQ